MVIKPKIGGVDPEIVVVPEKVIALPVRVDAALLTKLPFMSMLLAPALKLPLVREKIPLIVMLLPSVNVPEPVLERLARAVVLLGSSGPVVIEPVV